MYGLINIDIRTLVLLVFIKVYLIIIEHSQKNEIEFLLSTQNFCAF